MVWRAGLTCQTARRRPLPVQIGAFPPQLHARTRGRQEDGRQAVSVNWPCCQTSHLGSNCRSISSKTSVRGTDSCGQGWTAPHLRVERLEGVVVLPPHHVRQLVQQRLADAVVSPETCGVAAAAAGQKQYIVTAVGETARLGPLSPTCTPPASPPAPHPTPPAPHPSSHQCGGAG